MQKRLSEKIAKTDLSSKVAFAMGFIYALSLIPLIIISFYSHPANDDYSYGWRAHLAWESTGSITAVFSAVIENVKSFYNGWQGTFTSVFLMSIQPAVFSQKLYFLTTFLMLGMLILSVLLLFYVLFTHYLKIRRSVRYICAFSVLFLCTQVIESGRSAFYWYNGAIHYCFMHSCMILLIAFYLLSLKTENRLVSILSFIAACFLGFITGGANYVTALITPIIFILTMFFCLLGRQKKALLGLIPLAINLVCLGISVTAPGNSVRMAAETASMGAFEAIYYSFLYAIDGISEWSSVYVLFFTLLTVPFLFKELYDSEFSFPYPGAVAGLSYCIIAASYTPSLYSLGHGLIYDRTLNIMCMLFYLLFFLNLIYTTGWMATKCRKFGVAPELPALMSSFKSACGKSFAAGMTVFFISLLIFSDKDEITALSAIDSLSKGYAQSYHEESLYRLALLSMDGVDEVWVPNFTVDPTLLPSHDLSTDTDYYVNTATALWFGLDTVHLSEIY